MADIVQSLFGLTPEAYQQQQAAAADRMALEYAKMDPLQSARFAIGRGAYQLAGALGGQDPMLQMISNRQAIAQQIDYTNPQSMMAGVQALSQAGDTVGAMQLADILRKTESEMALRGQRMAATQASLAQARRAATTDVDVAYEKSLRIAEIENALKSTDMDDVSRSALQNELQLLQGKTGLTEAQKRLAEAQEYATFRGLKPGTPEFTSAVNEFVLAKITPESIRAAQANAEYIGGVAPTVAPPSTAPAMAPQGAPSAVAEPQPRAAVTTQPPETSIEAQIQLKRQQLARAINSAGKGSTQAKADVDIIKSEIQDLNKTLADQKKLSEFARSLQESGLTPGTPAFQRRMQDYIDAKLTGARKGTGNVTIGGITVDAGAASKKAGEIIGGGVANIEQQFSLQTAFKDAINLVNKGIYGGAYGPEQQFVAKFTGIGDRNKVIRTEQFMANIGEIVIPRLQAFGGNDSNEELKYLQKVSAGDLRLEPEAIKRILESAEKKVANQIKRLQEQASAGRAGAPLSTSPLAPSVQPPRVTKRWNPQTRQFEPVTGE